MGELAQIIGAFSRLALSFSNKQGAIWLTMSAKIGGVDMGECQHRAIKSVAVTIHKRWHLLLVGTVQREAQQALRKHKTKMDGIITVRFHTL
ncbi:hypothetical protein CUC53_14480 [Aeromonas cavernicola]|uniref:Uncharacterized protein n=1 Tax=Aeromonas cavernicola TaxID=1006623 RepID=A0A2H9U241_9GAMM|nr:hypothetical protein CUC53_14480 [Aeromonas cavernicola]